VSRDRIRALDKGITHPNQYDTVLIESIAYSCGLRHPGLWTPEPSQRAPPRVQVRDITEANGAGGFSVRQNTAPDI